MSPGWLCAAPCACILDRLRLMDIVEIQSRDLERRHPWETARAFFFLAVLRAANLPQRDTRTLDAGSGDAWFAERLAVATGASPVVCWDSGYADGAGTPRRNPALRFVKDPPEGRFDLALLLDVLEHVDDDSAFLGEIVEAHLTRGAAVLVSVPAWPSLLSEHDRRLRHLRRYHPADARALLERSGLSVVRSGGLFHSLLVARGLQVLRERLFGGPSHAHTGEWRGGPLLTRMLHAGLVADTALSAATSRVKISLPGLTWWALCKRSY